MGVDLRRPLLVKPGHPALERLTQLGPEGTSFVVAGHIGAGHHGSQVAQRYRVGVRGRRLGPVPPFGGFQPGQKLFGHGDQLVRVGRRAPLGCGLLPFEVQGRAHRRDSAPENLLGHRLLLRGQRVHHGLPVGRAGVQPPGPTAIRTGAGPFGRLLMRRPAVPSAATRF